MESNVNVFQFQGNNMIVRAKGPHIVKNVSIQSQSGFHTNLLSSTMNMPRNFEERSYTESTRSLYYGRATSPTMSVRSDLQPRNFHQPFYQGYSQRSTYGRGGSPVSMRSIDSTSSIDIIRAIENANFKEHEWRAIQLAFKRKQHFSRMAERRRRLRKHYDHRRKQSNDDSGEQGSNSSLSSDESIRTGYSRYSRHKENIPHGIPDYRRRDKDFRYNRDDNMHGVYDAHTQNPYRREADSHHIQNMALFQSQKRSNTMPYLQSGKENGFCSQNSALSAHRNMLISHSVINGHANLSSLPRSNLNSSISSTRSLQNHQTVISQKERFQNGYQFPSQRFNNSNMHFQDHDKNRSVQNMKKVNNNKTKQISPLNEDSDENDDIFPNTTLRPATTETNKLSKKRNIDSIDSVPVTANKKLKPSNKNDETKKETQTKNKNKEFVFAKPTFPVKKSAPAKRKSCEKLISKSAQFGNISLIEQEKDNLQLPVTEPVTKPLNEEKETDNELVDSTQLTTSEMSMRPSFMKRKLFTQTLDVTEKKNNSCESLASDSPQSNIYSELTREKHRTRKLVTSQSLLSRDVTQDDNNLLDLIHKIVPLSQVNTNKQPKLSIDKSTGDDKWDVTSIISTCNNDSVSDTYTDEEIFNVTDNGKNNKSREKSDKVKKGKITEDTKKNTNDIPPIKKIPGITKKCHVLVGKLTLPPATSELPKVAVEECAAKKPALSNSRLDAFWNTDVESDFECGTPVKHRVQGTSKSNSMPKQSTITNNTDIKSTPTTRKSKNIIDNSKNLVISENDSALVKTLKRQTNKQIPTTEDTKTTKNTKESIVRRGKCDKAKKGSPIKVIKTKIQGRNNSSVLKSAEKSRITKQTTPKASHSNKSDKSKIAKKENKSLSSSDNKKTEVNKKQNDILLTNKAKKLEPKNTIRKQHKSKNVQDDSDMLCKVLRSRHIDLSSSFNSDQFELTGISSVRKSRTPVKTTFLKKMRT